LKKPSSRTNESLQLASPVVYNYRWLLYIASTAGKKEKGDIHHAPSLADMAEIDQEVFEKHPFLRFWRGNYVDIWE